MAKTNSKRSPRAAKAEAQQQFAELLPGLTVEAAGKPEKAAEAKTTADKTLVQRAGVVTVEGVITGMAELQLSVGKGLADLGARLTREVEKLNDVQQAIALQSARLKELHDVEAAVISFKGLLEAQAERRETFEASLNEQKEAFDDEISRRRDEWKREQMQHEQQMKERDQAVRKAREREEEEYAYQLAAKRRKEQESFQAEQEAREKDLRDRMAQLAAREAELAELRQKAERFQTELAEAVRKTEQTVRAAVTEKFETEKALREKGFEGERHVLELKVASLEKTVASQTAQIEALTRQAAAAQGQVQEIALKVIEGASGAKALSAVNEIALEQAKKMNQK